VTIENFLERMISWFPEIRNEIEEHILEYEERLDSIVIEEIIMPEVIDLLKRNTDENKLQEIFAYFEDVCISGDEYLNNVFSITALEILGNEKTILETANKYMGPITIRLQREADLAIGRQI